MRLLFLLCSLIPSFCLAQWTQLGSDVEGQFSGGDFGNSIRMNATGSRFIVGAPTTPIDSVRAVGMVRVFEWRDNEWTQLGSDLLGRGYGEFFGNSVDISDDGSVIVVGSPCISVPTLPGYTAVYEWSGTDWVKRGTDIQGEENSGNLNDAGTAVAMNADGTVIAIGASTNSNTVEYSGHVRVYQWDGATWIQRGQDLDGTTRFSLFGTSVSLNSRGDVLAVGSAGAGIGGEVRVFVWDGVEWTQMGETLSGGKSNSFGRPVDLDTSGTVVIASGITHPEFGTGYTKVFSWDGVSWQQKGRTVLGDTIFRELFGHARLNADGNILVAGTRNFNRSFWYSVVMKYDGSDWVMVSDTIRQTDSNGIGGFAVDVNHDASRIIMAGIGGLGSVRAYYNPSVVSVEEVSAAPSQISVFPHPASDDMRMTSDTEVTSYRLMNMTGGVVRSGTNQGHEMIVNVGGLSTGTYVLVYTTANGTGSRLVQVQ